MQYSKYYCFPYSEEWKARLEEHRVPYKVAYGLLSFTLLSDSREDEPWLSGLSYLIGIRYSNKELEQAPFLWFQPFCPAVEVDTASSFEELCRYQVTWDRFQLDKCHHLRQVNPIQLKKEPKWKKKTAFYAMDTGHGCIFCDKRVTELITTHRLQGFDVRPTYRKDGQPSEHTVQLMSTNRLTFGDIALGHGETVKTCPLCGKPQIAYDGAYRLHIQTPLEAMTEDFYMTEDLFGEGIPYAMYMISQRFYQLLKQEQLLGSVNIAPVFQG